MFGLEKKKCACARSARFSSEIRRGGAALCEECLIVFASLFILLIISVIIYNRFKCPGADKVSFVLRRATLVNVLNNAKFNLYKFSNIFSLLFSSRGVLRCGRAKKIRLNIKYTQYRQIKDCGYCSTLLCYIYSKKIVIFSMKNVIT